MKILSNFKQKNSITSTLILLTCSFTLSLACSSSGGGGSAASPSPTPDTPIPDTPIPDGPIPEGLFLRPVGETDTKVYSNGQGLLSAGISTETLLGTFDHSELQIDIDDDPSDNISIGYSYYLTADPSPPEDNPDLEYSNNLFAINNNQLSFTGMDSIPPYTLQIDIARSVAINLPMGGRLDVDATGDTTDTDTRLFAFEGGAITRADVGQIAAANEFSFGGLKLLPVADTEADLGFRIVVARSVNVGDGTADVASGTAVDIRVAGSTIIIRYAANAIAAQLKSALDMLIGEDGILEGVFDIDETDYTSQTQLENPHFSFRGSDRGTIVATFEAGATVQPRVGSVQNTAIYAIYNSALANGAVQLVHASHGSNGSIVYHYGFDAELRTMMNNLRGNPNGIISAIVNKAAIPASNSRTKLWDIFGGQDGAIVTTGDVVPTHRFINVAGGNIYVADTETGTGKIISFEATSLRLPRDANIYNYHIIVDGAGAVSAVVDLPSDNSEFYVLGMTEERLVPRLGIDGIVFSDVNGGLLSDDIKVEFAWQATSGVEVELLADGNTISIKAHRNATYADLLEALQNHADVTAIVNVTTQGGYNANAKISAGNIGGAVQSLSLTGGVTAVAEVRDLVTDAVTTAAVAEVKATLTIGGLTITTGSNPTYAGAAGNAIKIFASSSGNNNSVVTVSANNLNIMIEYGDTATLQHMINAMNNSSVVNEGSSNLQLRGLVVLIETGLTPSQLNTPLADLFTLTYSFADDGVDANGANPMVNPTGTINNTGKIYSWKTDRILNTEDYIINLAP